MPVTQVKAETMVRPELAGPVRLIPDEFHRRREGTGWSVAETARRAGIDRTTLFRNLNGSTKYASPVVVAGLLRVLPYPSMFEVDERANVSA